jgi:hypothetical protein
VCRAYNYAITIVLVRVVVDVSGEAEVYVKIRSFSSSRILHLAYCHDGRASKPRLVFGYV